MVLVGLASGLGASTNNVMPCLISVVSNNMYPRIKDLFKDIYTIWASEDVSSPWLPGQICHISNEHSRVIGRGGQQDIGHADQNSRCSIVRTGEQREQTCHSQWRKNRAPIFRAVFCDNLLCYSCVKTQKRQLWAGIAAAVKAENALVGVPPIFVSKLRFI